MNNDIEKDYLVDKLAGRLFNVLTENGKTVENSIELINNIPTLVPNDLLFYVNRQSLYSEYLSDGPLCLNDKVFMLRVETLAEYRQRKEQSE